MDQLEQVRPETAAVIPSPSGSEPHRLSRPSPAGLAFGALAIAASAFMLARLRSGPAPVRGRVPSAFAPADRNLANASPAVLGDSPKRRFYAGRNLARAVSIEDLRAMAHRRLPRFALEYLEGGGDDEATLARNIAALAEWRFLPRALADVSHRDTSTELFGRRMAIPVAVAPTGLNAVFWPHADLRLAEAAAAAGVPYAQSTMSNDRMERVARVPGLRYWWQLYVFGPPEARERLIERARDAGCEALIVTTDAQTFGNREWHERTQADAKDLSWSARLDALLHAEWLISGMATHGMPRFENVLDYVPKDRRRFFDSAHWIRSQMDRGLSWDTVARIRERWPRKLIIKGILSVEDVERAASIGADAVALSNHGGRQLDWAVAPLDVLPEARRAVGDRIAILVDGGFRRGSDVLKAMSLGADAVFCGRAILYGVAAAGCAGAKRALDILHKEIDRDLALLGAKSIAELNPHLLMRMTNPGRMG